MIKKHNKITACLCTILILFGLASCTKDQIPNFTNNWDEDLYFFAEQLKDQHIDLFFNVSRAAFEQDIDWLRVNAATLSDKEILIYLTKLIHKIGDSHTFIELGNRLTFLPVKINLLDDGILITGIETGLQQYIGNKIIGVNNFPINTVLDSFRTVIAYENESNFKNQLVSFFRRLEFYNFFKFSTSDTELTLNLETGEEITLNIQNADLTNYSLPNPPLFLKNLTEIYWFEVLPEDNLIFIQYNACQEGSDLPFTSFTQQIVNQINANPEIEKLVLDLRHNGGGNSEIARPLIDELVRLVAENRLIKSKIYVIIGRKTFSSALLNALEIKDRVSPVFVGEPTGGKPNHFGEVKNFTLPNSFLKVWYSTKFFELSANNENALNPNIFIDYNADDFLNGIDPVVEWILLD